MAKLSAAELNTGLAHHTGTTSYTRHGLMRKLLLTEGVSWLAENAECHWLVDAIASHMATNKALQGERFQSWSFIRAVDDYSTSRPHLLSVTDGNKGAPIAKQEIDYTDFPLKEINLFAAYDDGLGAWVLMLPGEY